MSAIRGTGLSLRISAKADTESRSGTDILTKSQPALAKRLTSASVAGTITENAEPPAAWDVTNMDYAINNTHNVAQIFQSAGVTSGHLPVGNELRDVFVRNPSDRADECHYCGQRLLF